MLKFPASIISALLLIFLSASVRGDDTPGRYEITNAKVVTYDISGSSQKELGAQMKKKGPRGYYGYTEWNLKWSCAEITVECIVTMPRWEAGESTGELQKKWREFWSSLARHEQGHVDIVWKRVNETKKRVATMDCRRAVEAWIGTLRRINRESAEYDARTGHGTAQGALF